MKILTTFYLLLLGFIIPCFGMESVTINPIIKDSIIDAPNVYIGAGIFNEMVKRKRIEPTTANTRWCINALTTKPDGRKDIFAGAQKIEPALAREWLADYLRVGFQFAHARNKLYEAIIKDNTPLGLFLLSSQSRELSNSEGYDDGGQISFAYLAAKYNRKEILQSLMDAQCDIRLYALAYYRLAPIHIAVWYGNYECLKLMLEADLNPDYPCGRGKSALYHLCTLPNLTPERLECAFLLLDHGAKTDIIPAQDISRDQIIINLKTILKQHSIRKNKIT